MKRYICLSLLSTACLTSLKSDEDLVGDVCKNLVKIECEYDVVDECVEENTDGILQEGDECYVEQRFALECLSAASTGITSCETVDDFLDEPAEDDPCRQEAENWSNCCNNIEDDYPALCW